MQKKGGKWSKDKAKDKNPLKTLEAYIIDPPNQTVRLPRRIRTISLSRRPG